MIINPEMLKPKCFICDRILKNNEFVYCIHCEAKKKENEVISLKETKCEICKKEFDYGEEYYDDLCDICAEGEGRTFEEYK